MDGFHFDALARSLATAGSRRRALIGLVSGALGLVLGASAIDDVTAKKKCPPCKKRKAGKCKKKLPDGTTCGSGKTCQNGSCVAVTGCVPNCSGKDCGPNGCEGSCGTCNLGTCTDGTCVCEPGNKVCRGTCVYACNVFPPGYALNPKTCGCCKRPGEQCSPPGANTPECCTGTCLGNSQCNGIFTGSACQFDGECSIGFCVNGRCGCPAGREVCANGARCSNACQSGQIVRPGECDCCSPKGSSCTDGTCTCCCSGACDTGGVVCAGLGPGTTCTSDAQCESGQCLFEVDSQGSTKRSCL